MVPLGFSQLVQRHSAMVPCVINYFKREGWAYSNFTVAIVRTVSASGLQSI